MDLMKAMEMAAMGMKAQGVRMKVISENLANADTTAKSPNQNPYRRQLVTFKNVLDRTSGIDKVEVNKIVKDQSAFHLKYDPGNPAANAQGYVKMPNVQPLIELADMREAQRTYEANLGIIDMSRSMMMRTIDAIKA